MESFLVAVPLDPVDEVVDVLRPVDGLRSVEVVDGRLFSVDGRLFSVDGRLLSVEGRRVLSVETRRVFVEGLPTEARRVVGAPTDVRRWLSTEARRVAC